MIDDLAWEGYVRMRKAFDLPVPPREALDEWDPPVHINELLRWREYGLSGRILDTPELHAREGVYH